MKIEIQPESEKKEIEFPCLMIHENGCLVLMIKQIDDVTAEGIWVGRSASFANIQKWELRAYKPFKGRIILEND